MNCISHGSHKSLDVQGQETAGARLWIYLSVCVPLCVTVWVVGTRERAHL